MVPFLSSHGLSSIKYQISCVCTCAQIRFFDQIVSKGLNGSSCGITSEENISVMLEL